uniref:Uncharacterized protein n=1 Tax=Rhizophora mucronata TaxID=61149 RepID=A0A2P2K900_RHIMU
MVLIIAVILIVQILLSLAATWLLMNQETFT